MAAGWGVAAGWEVAAGWVAGGTGWGVAGGSGWGVAAGWGMAGGSGWGVLMEWSDVWKEGHLRLLLHWWRWLPHRCLRMSTMNNPGSSCRNDDHRRQWPLDWGPTTPLSWWTCQCSCVLYSRWPVQPGFVVPPKPSYHSRISACVACPIPLQPGPNGDQDIWSCLWKPRLCFCPHLK